MKSLLAVLGAAALLTGCVSSSPWVMDGISAGDAAFNSTRLRYANPESDSHLAFEMRKVGEEIDSYLFLKQFTWTLAESVNVDFVLGDEKVTLALPYLEGGMRLRVPRDMTERMILALHQGQKVSILVDGFEESLSPDQFAKSYNRFLGQKAFFQHLWKGPIE